MPKSQRRTSNRSRLNFTIDLLTLLLMLLMIVTGLVIRYVLPPGSGGRGGGWGLVVLGMDRHDWGGLHFWLSVGLVVLLLVHVALHWSWVCGIVRRWLRRDHSPRGKLSNRALNLSGVGFLVVLALLVAGFIYASSGGVEERWGKGYTTVLARGPQETGLDRVDPEERADAPALGRGRGGPGRGLGPARGLGPGQGPGRGQGEPGRGLGPGQGLGRRQGGAGRGLGPGQGLGRRQGGAGRGLGPGRGLGRGRGGSGRGLGRTVDRDPDGVIRGYMTLQEVANRTGVSTEKIKSALGLPESVSSHERLGRLGRRYGFLINDVRTVIAKNKKTTPGE
jgi:hypothetical protein